ncbi:MAG: ABC transporter ATP-binding protein [SAR324 cluster bacterium]|nr:ABC transporter ATP-binding protein [SAR324 cluster bacterium]
MMQHSTISSSMNSPALEIQNLSVRFGDAETGATIIDDVSLKVKSGEILGLVGESGSGKSVTCLAALGLLGGSWHTEGKVRLQSSHGQESMNSKQLISVRGRDIAMIFQDATASLNPIKKIGKQLTNTVIRLQGIGKSKAKQVALELLRRVEMADPEECLHSYPFQMSGGQNQRVMIALALAGNPSLLLADEPTTALDVIVQSQILKLISSLRNRTGMGVVFVTHDLGVVNEICDTVAVMYAGSIVESGTVQQIMESPRHPYTKGLIDSMPTLKGNLPDGIEGQVPAPKHRHWGCAFSPRCVKAESDCARSKPIRTVLDETHSIACFHPLTDKEVTKAPRTKVDLTNVKKNDDPVPLLFLENASCDYATRKGKFRAVSDITISLRFGESLALIGESGSGKSTVGKLILGVEASSEGKAHFEGKKVPLLGTAEHREFARSVQLIPQNPYLSFDPRVTIGAQIEEPLDIHRIGSARERHQRRNELLDAVGLTAAHGDRYPHQVSGGQCQRAVIARALILEPKLLICDEATASLDVSVQARIIDLLRELQIKFHLSLVFITHDLRLVRSVCNRVAVLRSGKLVEENEIESLFLKPQHQYTQELLASVPDIPAERKNRNG